MRRIVLTLTLACTASLPLSGCAVITVASTAASVAATGAGLAADAAIGTVRLTGRAIGAAASVVLPSSD